MILVGYVMVGGEVMRVVAEINLPDLLCCHLEYSDDLFQPTHMSKEKTALSGKSLSRVQDTVKCHRQEISSTSVILLFLWTLEIRKTAISGGQCQ